MAILHLRTCCGTRKPRGSRSSISEQAAFDDGEYFVEDAAEQMALFVKNRKKDDIALLWATLRDIGVTDERPALGLSPLAPTGW